MSMMIPNGRRRVFSGMLTTMVLVAGVFCCLASAATYYIAPSGSDRNSGTSSQPWGTWAYALRHLHLGDALVAENGTYDEASEAGFPNIDCAAGYANGTASQPITVRAEQERQAFIKNNGRAAGTSFVLKNCSYWTIEGLRIENADFDDGTQDNGSVVNVSYADHIVLRRLLVQKPNRYRNSHAISLYATRNSLIEECEVYSYHRHGIILRGGSSNNVVRRCYINSRNYADISGGYGSVDSTTGDAAIINYPGSSNIIENNIAEIASIGFETIAASQSSSYNRFLGNIANRVGVGLLLTPQSPFTGFYVTGNTAENMVVSRATNTGIWARSGISNICDQCTVLNGSQTGILADQVSSAPPTLFSFYSDNSLAAYHSGGGGFVMKDQFDLLLNYPNAYANKSNFYPDPTRPEIINELMIDPKLGSCIVFIPSGSPMKGAGANGRDIGANVLYRYRSGVLTAEPLWNRETGGFPCGAIVPGVNDQAGVSCFDLHTRLNVNTNGCAFPAGYR